MALRLRGESAHIRSSTYAVLEKQHEDATVKQSYTPADRVF
jgi:hypothetical protein